MFGANQRRYFANQLRYIDEILGDAAEQLDPRPSEHMFQGVVPDATAAQRKTLRDFLAQLRFVLRRFMDAHDLRDERIVPSGLWAFRTAISFARVAAQELRPRYWSGYGPVDPAAAAAANQLAAELITVLDRIEQYLVRGAETGLEARISQLEALSQEVSLLRELDRIVSTHGLTELRTALERLIDRAAAPRFEIAVFGRVSSGKSSLLNWWLERPVLPTGVTPVTTVPTLVTHGISPRVRLTVANSSESLEIAIGDLSRFVTEEGNPENTKDVLEILIEVPARRLQNGIYLVDTPGLGSLPSAGAMQTLEYLPRCDLGILLIEAAAPITREDIDVARALLHAGGELLVLTSKADRLSAADWEQTRAYVHSQFESELQASVNPRPVSTVGEHAALASAWFDRELAPRIAEHQRHAARSLRRKLAVLRESAMSLLESRLALTRSPLRSSDPSPTLEVVDHTAIAEIRVELEGAHSSVLGARNACREISPRVLNAAREELARSWSAGDRATTTNARVARAMWGVAREPGDALTRVLHQLHGHLSAVLKRSANPTPEATPPPRGRPVLELSLPGSGSFYGKPPCLPPFLPIARLAARARLSPALLASVQRQLSLHGEALLRWGRRYLDDLAAQFNVTIAPLEGIERLSHDAPTTPAEMQATLEDLKLLRGWPPPS